MKTSVVMWILILVAALAQAQPPATSTSTTTANAVSKERAAELYTTTCQACHGPDGKGSPLMKDSAFLKRQWKHGTRHQDLVNTITNGVPGTMMLPFKEKLKPEEIDALATLVRSFDKALKPAGVKK